MLFGKSKKKKTKINIYIYIYIMITSRYNILKIFTYLIVLIINISATDRK